MFDDDGKRLGIILGITERMYCYRTCLNLYGMWERHGTGSAVRIVPKINQENVRQYFQSGAQKFEMNSDFGDRPYDAEALIVQLGYRYHLDYSNGTTPDFKAKVDSIEKLNTSEYKAFWSLYGVAPMRGDPSVLCGSAAFDFEYHDQNYKDIVLQRLSQDD